MRTSTRSSHMNISNFQGVLDMMHWAGYKLVWESVPDLISVSPISGSRWLAIFIPSDSDWTMPRTGDFIVFPKLSLHSFRAMIPLPDEHEWLLTLDSELREIYGDWKLFQKSFFQDATSC